MGEGRREGSGERDERRPRAARPASGGKLPRTIERVWAMDVVAAPAHLGGVDVALVIVVTAGGLRHIAPLPLPVEAEAVTEALGEALHAPGGEYRPARPDLLVVRTEALREAAAPVAEAQAFDVVVDPRVDMDGVVKALSVHLLSATGGGPWGIMGVPNRFEEAFAREASRFAAERPWERADETFILHLARWGAPLRFSVGLVIGAAGALKGVALYEDLRGIQAARTWDPRAGLGAAPASLSVHLEPRSAEDLVGAREIEALGYVPTDGLYPSALGVEPGVGGPIDDDARGAELVFALGAMARYFEDWSAHGRPRIGTLEVEIGGLRGSVELDPRALLRGDETSGPRLAAEPLFDWDADIYLWPPGPAAETLAQSAGLATEAEGLAALVFKSTKAHARRGIRRLRRVTDLQVHLDHVAAVAAWRARRAPSGETGPGAAIENAFDDRTCVSDAEQRALVAVGDRAGYRTACPSGRGADHDGPAGARRDSGGPGCRELGARSRGCAKQRLAKPRAWE